MRVFPSRLILSFKAQKITQKLNSEFHTQAEIVALFRELTDLPVDDSFICFPPFHTDFGKNIHIGKKRVFQYRLFFSRSRWHFYRRRHDDRYERQYSHAQPWFEFGYSPHHLPCAGTNWQKCLVRLKRDHFARRNYWQWCRNCHWCRRTAHGCGRRRTREDD